MSKTSRPSATGTSSAAAKKNARRSSIVAATPQARPISRSETKSGKKSKNATSDSPDPEREEQAAADAKENDPSLAWKVVTAAQMDDLYPLAAIESGPKLAEIFGLEDYETNLRTEIKLDFYVNCYWFSKENRLSRDQTSAFFTLMKGVLDAVQEKSFVPSESFAQFKAALVDNLWLSTEPSDGEKWDPYTARKIADYAATGPFQHYRLYQNVATCPMAMPENAPDDADFGGRPLTGTQPIAEEGDGDAGGEINGDDVNTHEDGEQNGEGSESPALFPATVEDAEQVTSALINEPLDGFSADIRNRLKKTESAISMRLQKVEKGLGGDPS